MTRRCLWLTKGLGRGGAERLLVDLFPLMDPERYEVDVAYVLPWKDNYHAELVERGARVTCLDGGKVRSMTWGARLARLVAEREFDVIHTHAPLPAIVARLVLGMRSSPTIVHTEHNMWGRYRVPTRVANSLTYRFNSSVIAVSDVVAGTIDPWPSAPDLPVVTIHHGTNLESVRSHDPSRRRDIRVELGLPVDRFVIGNVGNFTAKKNHRALLQAMARPAMAKAHLALVGLGPLESQLKEEVARLEIDDQVSFLGSRDDVFDILPVFDAFCLSSSFEGFPIALVEAMATGLPVVATSVGGIPELLEDGENGLMVPSGDVDALVGALERIMDDPTLAASLGQRARTSTEALDLRVAAAATQDLYDQALQVG